MNVDRLRIRGRRSKCAPNLRYRGAVSHIFDTLASRSPLLSVLSLLKFRGGSSHNILMFERQIKAPSGGAPFSWPGDSRGLEVLVSAQSTRHAFTTWVNLGACGARHWSVPTRPTCACNPFTVKALSSSYRGINIRCRLVERTAT
jgi:hypothetical protein